MAASCGVATPTTPTTPATVTGEAGDLEILNTDKDEEGSMKEGEEDVKVLGYKLTAEDSDISISNVKIWMQNDGTADSSEKLVNYFDEVKVFLGDEEVGSADTSDFSKDTGVWDEFTKSISLSNAVIAKGDSEYLYVTVSAVSNVDSEDINADWDVEVRAMRFTDGIGAIMSALAGDLDNSMGNIKITDESTDDNLAIKSSSSNPATSTVGVDADNETDDVLIGSFKLDVDQDSSDITLLELPIALEVTGATATDIEDVVTEVYVTIDGERYEAEAPSTLNTVSPFNDTYTVDLSDESVVIASDDTVEVKIYASFESMTNNYAEGTTIQASIADNTIQAEGSDDLTDSQRDGAFTGKIHTLSAVDIDVTEGTAVSPKYSLSDKDQKVEYTLNVKVTNNGDEDVYIPFGAVRAAAYADGVEGLAFVLENSTGTDYASGAVSVSVEAEDGDIEQDHSFLIAADGEDYTLVLKVTLDNTTGTAAQTLRLALTDVAYVADDAVGSASASEVTADLTNIRTATYLVGYGA